MKKNAKKTTVASPKPATPPKAAPEPKYLSLATIELMRNADSLANAVRILAPPSRTKINDTYIVNASCEQPLPAQRGACLDVLATAVRLNRPFTLVDITQALPASKSARFQVRRLALSGHFTVVTE